MDLRAQHDAELSAHPEDGLWGIARRAQSAVSNGFVHRWAAHQIPDDARVLDAACGDGRLGRVWGGQWTGVDFLYRLARRARAYTGGKPVGVADISRLPFRDDSFDVVSCFEVLEHLDDPAGALGEMARVLRPGGSLLLSVPNDAGIKHRLKRDPHPLHQNEMDEERLRSLLVGAGYVVDELHYRGLWLFTPGKVSVQIGMAMPRTIAANILVRAHRR